PRAAGHGPPCDAARGRRRCRARAVRPVADRPGRLRRAAGGGLPMSARRWQDALSRLSIYLPVMLMGLLALASYWLLRITPAPAQPEPERPVTEHPDFFMRGFAVKAFDERGRIKSEVRGTEGRHYPHNETLVI